MVPSPRPPWTAWSEGELKATDLVVVIGGNFGEATGATFMEIAKVADLQKKYKA